jgi:acetyltransferase-like isoleucine patch superfamily enzyme
MFRLINFFRKIAFFKKVQYQSENSALIIGNNVLLYAENGSRIILNGKVTIGIPLSGLVPGYTHKSQTIITLAQNATLNFKNSASIAPGTTIKIAKNGTLTFEGKNVIAHDTTIIASREIKIGRNTSISWNCNLIDDDGHDFFRADGKKIKRIRKPLHIGDNVGIQMNVTIPAGCLIGDNSIISANTVIRKNIPANSLTYTTCTTKTVNDYTTGFQFI